MIIVFAIANVRGYGPPNRELGRFGAVSLTTRGVVGQGRGGTASTHFFQQGDASPTPPLFWTEIRAKVSPLLQLVTY